MPESRWGFLRCACGSGLGVKDWTFETPDLLEFIGEVEDVIRLSKMEIALTSALHAGVHCDKSFCRGRINCPAYQARTQYMT